MKDGQPFLPHERAAMKDADEDKTDRVHDAQH